MAYDPNEPRDERGRWARAAGAAMHAIDKTHDFIIKVADLIHQGNVLDAKASANIMRKAEALRKYNNKIAAQRMHHPRNVPHTASPIQTKRVKVVEAGYVSAEAKAALDLQIKRAAGLETAPERLKPGVKKVVPMARNARGELVPTAFAGPVEQKIFNRAPGWVTMGTGLRPASVGGSRSEIAAPRPPKFDPPPRTSNGNIDPYKPAMRSTRAVGIKRTEEFPATRYTTRTVPRYKAVTKTYRPPDTHD